MRFPASPPRACARLALLTLFALSATALPSLADPIPLRSVRPGRLPSDTLFVFVTPPAPAEAEVSGGRWQVFVWSGGVPPSPIGVVSATLSPAFASDRLVTITLASKLVAPVERLDVVFSTKAGERSYATYQTPRSPKPSPRVVPAEKREDADVYFEGIVAPSSGQKTKYTVDALANYTLQEFGQIAVIELESEFKVDDTPSLDPDSIRAALKYTRFGTTNPANWFDVFNLHWRVAALELEKTGDVVNFVTAPSLIRPFITRTYYTDADGARQVSTTSELDLALAIELGGNLRNAASVAADPEDGGTGAILRVVPSATVYFLWRSVPFGEGLNFKAHLESRILARDELFLETRTDAEDPVPRLDKRVRHYAVADVEWMAHDFIGFTVGYEYGSLPPSFKFVDHKGTAGVVLKFKWQ